MIPKYENIGGSNGYKLEKFVVFDVPHKGIPFNLFDEIGDYLEDGLKVSKFDENRNISDNVYLDYILIEYEDKNIRDRDIINNSKINIINCLKSEKIDGDKQLAENTGNFEYNGKFYLVLNPYNPFVDETNIDLGLYKGVIIDSDKYSGIGKESQNEIIKTVEKVENIID